MPLTFLLLFNLHRQLIGTLAYGKPHYGAVSFFLIHVLSILFRFNLLVTVGDFLAAANGDLGSSCEMFGD